MQLGQRWLSVMILRMSDALNLPTPQSLLRAKWSSWNPLTVHNEQGRLGVALGMFAECWGLDLELGGSCLVNLTPMFAGEKSKS